VHRRRAWDTINALRLAHGEADVAREWFEALASTSEEASEMEFQENANRMESRVKKNRRI